VVLITHLRTAERQLHVVSLCKLDSHLLGAELVRMEEDVAPKIHSRTAFRDG
jgi:hypothetical protein